VNVVAVIAAIAANSFFIVVMRVNVGFYGRMSADSRAPMSVLVTGPAAGCKFVGTVLIIANLAKSVLVFVNVLCRISGINAVSAGGSVPVIGFVI
jgi:hypothetical protein